MPEEAAGDLETIGYFCAAVEKKSAMDRPMAYGRSPQPGPECLLFERGATLFDTEETAWKALQQSLTACQAEGDEWIGKYRYAVLPVTRVKPSA